jgi:5-formyltetrahydrofolate cyclo-ligase
VSPSADDPELALRHGVKQALRQQMRAIRDAHPPEARRTRSLAIAERLTQLPEFRSAKTVAAFASIGSEADTMPIMEAAWADSKLVALPRLTGERMSLHSVLPETKLQPGPFAVPEPAPEQPLLPPERVDFVIVPALAVDPRGHRIGYGKGCYDQLLPSLSQAFSCVIAYDFQLLAEVPEQPFDVPVDGIVTDVRVIRP